MLTVRSLTCSTAITLTLAASGAFGQQIEIRAQPGVVVMNDGGGEEVMFDGPMDGDGPMMLVGGPGGLSDMIGGAVAGGGGAYTFPISAADLAKYAKILKFSPDQAAAANSLLDGYATAFKTKADAAKEKVASIREAAKENEERDWWQKTLPITKELRQERDRAEEAFLTDYKSIASKEQAARWEKVEMYRRRSKAMRGMTPFGPAGERVDLSAIVDSLDLDAALTGKLEPIMDNYERDVDIRLREQTDVQTKQREAMKDAAKNHDFSLLTKAENDRYDAGVKMRDTHRTYAAQITTALPKEAAEKFDTAFRRAVYPRIYRERYAGKAITAAEGLDDLKGDQRTALATLKEKYRTQTADLNRRTEAAQQAAEQAARDKQKAEASQDGNGGVMIRRMITMDADPQADSQRAERKEIEDATVKSLLEILSPAQSERLPPRPGSLAQEEGVKVRSKAP
ncbi:MAG: hypothetical protein QM783_06775 [Phycisphaerales bacterium]